VRLAAAAAAAAAAVVAAAAAVRGPEGWTILLCWLGLKLRMLMSRCPAQAIDAPNSLVLQLLQLLFVV
jgi:hypothetical protein